MGQSVEIRRFTAQYHLRPSQFAEKDRLDRLLPEVAGDALELALERAGIREHEIVCIRSVYIPVRLRLSRVDSALAADWAAFLAEAIAQGAVRYGSRTQALIEMGSHIAQGRFHLIWAWRQIGLWQGSGETANRPEGALEFAAALAREPQAAVVVLASLATAGRLRPLAPHLAEAWTDVAMAVLASAGLQVDEGEWNAQARELRRAPGPLPIGPAAAGAADRVALRRARRAMERSSVLRESAGLALPDAATLSVSVLALLEVEPSLVRAGIPQLFEAARAVTALVSGAALAPGAPPAPVSGPGAPASGQGDSSERALTPGAAPKARPNSLQTEMETPLPAEGFTGFGGLLYLIHLVDALHIPARSLSSSAIAARGLEWFLHRLALTLQPLQPDDPAALGFAGLAPAAQHPSLDQPLPSDEERDLIEAFAQEIRRALAEALPEPVRPPEMLRHFVCRRTAQIVADPGWLEVRFPLAEVSTEIRRAGLDIDPNYVPWLGLVVRFAYE